MNVLWWALGVLLLMAAEWNSWCWGFRSTIQAFGVLLWSDVRLIPLSDHTSAAGIQEMYSFSTSFGLVLSCKGSKLCPLHFVFQCKSRGTSDIFTVVTPDSNQSTYVDRHEGERVLWFIWQNGFNWKLKREIDCFKRTDQGQKRCSVKEPENSLGKHGEVTRIYKGLWLDEITEKVMETD